MLLYSTNNPSLRVNLKTAVLKGLSDDNGLFMPTEFPKLSDSFFKSLHEKSFQELSFEVAQALFDNEIPDTDLKAIIDDAINFDAPLVQLDEQTFVLELFHGPTLAFKDFGARFLSRLMKYFLKDSTRELVILVATSGDTGSAVAQGFFGMKNVRVILLYPSGKVSHVQEQQLTTIGGNVTALEIDGSFDDCQKLVKEAFLDSDLNSRLMLSSANSINIARLIPQMFYYFRAVSQLKSLSKPIVFSVPSGNFGNLTAGLFAKKMGLPISHFVASTNINDVVPQYLDSGNFSPRSSAQTLSNAMDVGNPSNFARMLALYGKVHSMRFDIYGSSYSDAQTLEAISRIYKKHHYVAEPHGAIGWLGLESYRKKTIPEFQGIFLETAHPAKFPEAVKSSIGIEPELPQRLKAIIDQEKKSILMQANFADFKSFLLASS